MTRATIALAMTICAAHSTTAFAQSPNPQRFALLGQFAGATSSEFSGADLGGGALFAWHAAEFLGAEAEMNFYPKNLTAKGRVPFSRSRVEALFGISAGPRLGRVRPFGAFHTGFVKFQSPPTPIACPAIFPPILSCVLAQGEAVLATYIGGGIEAFPMPHAVVRLDLGDRLMHYPGASIDASGAVHNMAFYMNEFRFVVGAGVRC